MVDVFISYSRQSEARARLVVNALVDADYEVWWDQDLLPHATFGDETEERLGAAKAVLVLWSEPGVRSQWVRAEAEVGRTTRKLIQASLDGATPPLPFSQVQVANLADWNGDPRAPAWGKVLASVAHLTGKTGAAPQAAAAASAVVAPRRRRRVWEVAVLAALVMLALAAGAWWALRPAATSYSEPRLVVRPFRTAGGLPGVAAAVAEQIQGVLTANVPGLLLSDAATGDATPANLAIGGSVTRDGDRWRVSAQIEDVRSKTVVWTRQFDRPASGQGALAEEVAASIADAIGSIMDAGLQKGLRLDPQTLALFVKASEASKNPSPDEPGLSRQLLEQLLARQPNMAGAYGSLALRLVAESRGDSPAQAAATGRQARAAARRAIQIDASASGGAYDALFFLTRLEAPRDLARAEAWLLEGLRRTTDSFPVPMRECQFLSQVGRAQDALAYCERAAGMRPLAAPPSHFYANALYSAGSLELASRAVELAARRHPTQYAIRRTRFELAAFSGDPDRARALMYDPETAPFWRTRQVEGLDAFLRARKSGATADAVRAIGLLRGAADPKGVDHRYPIMAASALGRVDEAFDMARAHPCQIASSPGPGCLFEPATAAMRRDPRFMELAAQAGLVRYWRTSGQWPDFCADRTLPYDCKTEAAKYQS
jgi:hypothetical protein